MGMASFAVAEMGPDERDYDNWLTTLTQASVRLDQLQKVQQAITACPSSSRPCRNASAISGWSSTTRIRIVLKTPTRGYGSILRDGL